LGCLGRATTSTIDRLIGHILNNLKWREQRVIDIVHGYKS